MGYVEENLVSGERVAYRAHLHWRVLVGPVVFFSICFLVADWIAFRVIANRAQASEPVGLMTGIAIAAVLVGLIPLLGAIAQKRAAEFAVTNRRVILKDGILRRRTLEMFLEKIESVGVDQTIWGRILNYGTITVQGTGGTHEPFHNISHPLEFRHHVQECQAPLNLRPANPLPTP
jgi:uncharacterized membrane protein YdbT with pleckstrin-like domain